MFPLLDITFQHTGSLWFIETSHFQYLRSIEPPVRPPAHYRNAFAHPIVRVSQTIIKIVDVMINGHPHLIYWHTTIGGLQRRINHREHLMEALYLP